MENREDKLRRLQILIRVSSLINSTLESSEIELKAVEALTTLLDAEAGSLLLLDEATGELVFEMAVGEKGGTLKESRLRPGEGVAGWVAAHREPLIVGDVRRDKRFSRRADRQTGFTTRNILAVPVLSRGKLVGVLEGINKRQGDFGREDLDNAASLAHQVAVAIENARLYEGMRETFLSTIAALSETIELRDPYTGGHTQRVMAYSTAVGRRMGLSRAELETLRLSAILHDIGKIGVPDEILLKGSFLSPAEQDRMNRHPQFGSDILRHIRQLKDVVAAVRSHHERYDGLGYPDGLEGSGIPLLARIIAVADTFDAMTSDRPYRAKLNFAEAFKELRRNAGTQFDPAVVKAFVKAWKEGEVLE